MVNDGFGGIAAFKAGSPALADAIDGPGEVAEKITCPGSEFSALISYNEV
jgi:hypothetical protein